MAAVADMGEVDEMHSKEEGSILTNGDLSNDVDSRESLKEPESMDVDEPEHNEAKEKQEIVSTTEDSTEDNDNTVEESSVATENRSELNDDESSQETKTSEAATGGGEESAHDVDVSDDEKSKVDVSDDEKSKVDVSDDEKSKVDVSDDEKSKADVSDDDKSKVDVSDDEKSKADVSDDDKSKAVTKENTESNENSKEKAVSINEEDEIHEIVSDDDDDLVMPPLNKISNMEPIELNDSGGDEDDDGDVMIVDSPKENGTEVIDLHETPEKKPKRVEVVTPRRSTRNLNKNKSYVESDKEEGSAASTSSSEESDVEEVLPQDPLACNDAITVERISVDKPKTLSCPKPSTIVVKDTKRLVEIANKSNSTTTGKKEPTLVIIDTNSILSGRGPVPVNNTRANLKPTSSAKLVTTTTTSTSNNPAPTPSTPSYPTMLPMALPAQGMYPPNMRATITPIPLNSTNVQATAPPKTSPATISPALTTPLLPTLTDDMFVVEAPSFIVPYVYEKPPVKDFKGFVKDIQQDEVKTDKDKTEEKGDEEEKKESKVAEQKDVPVPTIEPKKDVEDPRRPYSYFESPLGKFFINIGFNLVQEFVQSDLLKQQKRKASREGGSNPETEKTIKSLAKNLEFSKENNEPFKSSIKKCEYCNFKTESGLVMSYHLETPHMKNFVYKCNFCPYEVRSPHDILFHMEAEHTVRGHLERAPAFHQCPSCPFEDNQKGKMSRHLVACMRKFKPERNLEPPVDWEPPAKIPRVPKMRQQGLNATAAAYQALSKNTQYQFLSKMQLQSTQQVMQRGRGRPTLGVNQKPQTVLRPSGMVFKQQAMSGGSVLVPTNYQLSGNQVFQNQVKKQTQQPSISITPLPRGTSSTASSVSPATPAKPGDTASKNSFVICEICDGYIKDLEQLRNHMQWIHKIKIHPKMIYNRPPLNCQKCQFRFFTDQGLERHLLGSHGLVTSSMQDAANKSKDSGRCPVCGRVYQWKLLNHVARDHNMTLKPAHLSYKCTVCTATFGMYKQFENHVYSAHSVVAKRVMDKKGANSSLPANKSEQMKPMKINDEITIIPQPAKSTNGASKEGSPSSTGSSNSKNSTPSTSKNIDTLALGSSSRRNADKGD